MGTKNATKKYYWARYYGTQDWVVVTEGFTPSNYVRCGDEEDIHPSTFAQVIPFAVGPPRTLLTDEERAVLPPPKYKVGDRVNGRYTYMDGPLLPEKMKLFTGTVIEIVQATPANHWWADGYLVQADNSIMALFQTDKELVPYLYPPTGREPGLYWILLKPYGEEAKWVVAEYVPVDKELGLQCLNPWRVGRDFWPDVGEGPGYVVEAGAGPLPGPSPGSTWVWNLVTKTWDVVKEA